MILVATIFVLNLTSKHRSVILQSFGTGFSPWNVPIIERKMQIQTRMIPEEIDQGLGCEHRVST